MDEKQKCYKAFVYDAIDILFIVTSDIIKFIENFFN